MNDREFEAAYRAFIESDAWVKAPDPLRLNVLAHWDDRHHARLAETRSRTASVRGFVAAAVVLIVAGVVGHYAVSRFGVAPVTIPTRAVDSASSARSAAKPIVRLVADSRFDTESLQIVRLRLPGASLQPFGMDLDSDQAGLVEVDLLVGDDGLPREIRSIEEVAREVQ
jgi:hypothetical protein